MKLKLKSSLFSPIFFFFFWFPRCLEKIFHFHSFIYPVSDTSSFILGLSSLSLSMPAHEVPWAMRRIIKYHVFSTKCHNSHITCFLTLRIQMAKYKKTVSLLVLPKRKLQSEFKCINQDRIDTRDVPNSCTHFMRHEKNVATGQTFGFIKHLKFFLFFPQIFLALQQFSSIGVAKSFT